MIHGSRSPKSSLLKLTRISEIKVSGSVLKERDTTCFCPRQMLPKAAAVG